MDRLDEGSGIEETLVAKEAVYHQTCKLKYNKTKLDRAEKRQMKMDFEEEEVIGINLSKRT